MKKAPAKTNHKEKPEAKWQTGKYEITQEFRFRLPYGFLLLCKLWNTTPNVLLTDFMDNLSCGSWNREGRDKAKEHQVNYMLEMGYGQQHCTREDIQQMFIELNAIGMLWPQKANMKMINLHSRWRNKYYNWWFKKWWQTYRRKL